ncbi:hypothetical protein HUG17_0036 [Dermatophagoides farinae]|nr:hypothetical protein HUG17_0036 [Dermatophagoides farinae]
MRFLSSSIMMVMAIIAFGSMFLIDETYAQRRRPRNYNHITPLSLGQSGSNGGGAIGGVGNGGRSNSGANGRGPFFGGIFNRRGGGANGGSGGRRTGRRGRF